MSSTSSSENSSSTSSTSSTSPSSSSSSSTSSSSDDSSSGTVELRALIEAHSVGGIIGKEGLTVKKIRQETNAVVSILKPNSSTSFPHSMSSQSSLSSQLTERILLIKGQPDTVNQAIGKITQIMLDSGRSRVSHGRENSSSSGGDNVTSTNIRLLLHQSLVGAIIGRNGEVIKNTSTSSGARISVSNQALPNSTDKSVSITGTPAAIQAATTLILQQISENPLRVGVRSFPYHPTASVFPSQGYGVLLGQANQSIPQVTQKIAIPSNASGAIIGKGGAVIRDLRVQSQCQISIADPDSQNSTERIVTLTGSMGGIQVAMHLIRVAVENVTARADHDNNNHNNNNHNSHERKPRKYNNNNNTNNNNNANNNARGNDDHQETDQ